MPGASNETELLFGLLALQNGLIDQESLVAAFRSWTRDRSRGLADLLIERGALDPEDKALVGSLVERHVFKHGGDPQRSLSTVRADRDTYRRLADGAPPDVEATIAYVASTSAAIECDGDPTLGRGTGPRSNSRYVLLRPLASGGIGRVGVALDTELNREVALKEIHPHLADGDEARGRFLVEAEVTGRLEHPGIVPVYGLGADAAGRPFYAMRLIRGDSLKQAIDRAFASDRDRPERSLEWRGLLSRFVAACYAVAYAHSRGVVHRDLKPANVMLGPYGETLVVDWGLAKAVGREARTPSAEATLKPSSAEGSGASETRAGSVVGTPAFMSPEQAEGRLDRVGPASDIYGLGATLYALLTGRAPISGGDVPEVLRKAREGDFPRPRSIEPTIPHALEAIVLKAMARAPESRYASVRALAEDVERWLADEPISARRDPASVRLSRWARRHKPLVVGAAVLLLAAVVGLSIGAALLQTANARTARQRDQARMNFELARHAVDDYLSRVAQNPLLKEKGLNDLRGELLEAAARYYRDFLAQHGTEPGLRTEAAAAYERLGEAAIEAGKPIDALAAFDRGIPLAESLTRERPGDRTLAALLVRLLAGRGLALQDAGRASESLPALRQAVARAPHPADHGDELCAALARVQNRLAIALKEQGKSEEAIRAAIEAVRLGEARIRARSDDLDAAKTLLWSYSNAAQYHQLSGRGEDAGAYGRKGAAFGAEQAGRHPGDVDIRMFQAEIERGLALGAKSRGDLKEAVASLTRGLEIIEGVTATNPMLIRPRIYRANAWNELSQVHSDLGRFDAAESAARKTIEQAEALAKEVPTSLYIRATVGYGYASLGKLLTKRKGSEAESLRCLRRAVEVLESTDDVSDLYNAACSLSLASTVVDPTAGPSDSDRRRRDADRAAATLKTAVDKGFGDIGFLETDPDLAAIRGRDDFRAILRSVQDRSRDEARGDPKPK